MPRYAITERIANAIADQEGFTSGASRVARENNNPGNIRYWTAGGPTRNGYAVFPDLATGWQALYKVVDDYIDGRYTGGQSPTLEGMFAVYAPTADRNDPANYARFVATRTGIPLGVRLVDYAGGATGGGGGYTAPPGGGPVTVSSAGSNAAGQEIDPQTILLAVCAIGIVYLLFA